MSTEQPNIAVVMPAYNAARFIHTAIDSVIAQTFTDWTLIVVDDGSTDDTSAIVARFASDDARISLYRQVNSGVSAARNSGYAISSNDSEFVMFLDADDALESSALQALRDTLQADGSAVAAYGLARGIDEAGEYLAGDEIESHQRGRLGVEGGRVVAWARERPTTFAVESVMEFIITPGTVLIRREAFKTAGGFAPDLSLWEDWDLWLRLTRVGDMRMVDTPVLRYRRHAENASNTAILELAERTVRRRLLDSLAGDKNLLKVAQIGYRYHQQTIARRRISWASSSLREGHLIAAANHLRHAMARLISSFTRHAPSH